MIILWLFGVPWLLPLFFLIFGFIITIGPLTGIQMYSRRRQPAKYWWHFFLLCVLIIVVEIFYWNLFLDPPDD
jgi:hypothetical protein